MGSAEAGAGRVHAQGTQRRCRLGALTAAQVPLRRLLRPRLAAASGPIPAPSPRLGDESRAGPVLVRALPLHAVHPGLKWCSKRAVLAPVSACILQPATGVKLHAPANQAGQCAQKAVTIVWSDQPQLLAAPKTHPFPWRRRRRWAANPACLPLMTPCCCQYRLLPACAPHRSPAAAPCSSPQRAAGSLHE